MNCNYLPSGDRMVLVEFPEEISSQINSRVRRFSQLLEQRMLTAVQESLSAYRSLGVIYDPLKVSYDCLVAKLRVLEAELRETSNRISRQIEIPVCYGGQFGPDLKFVAQFNHLPLDEVVKIHSSGEYVVHFLGFSPGFPYLGGMPVTIATPRLETPRLHVPAGSVAIGGRQTGVYSADGPGGWRIIGRTPRPLFRPFDKAPFLMHSGDRVKFRPITASEYADLSTIDASTKPSLEGRGRPVFLVKRPGILTTIQDGGRVGFQRHGVPVCGAMDRHSMRLGNHLVGNSREAPALEITVTGPELQALAPCQIALAGADLSAELDGNDLPLWENHWLRPGQTLSFGQRGWGVRSYLCVEGGFEGDEILGSCSTDLTSRFGGFQGRRLEKGDILRLRTSPAASEAHASRRVSDGALKIYTECRTLRVIAGPQIDCFARTEIEKFYSNEFRISPNANRMGYLLEGPKIAAQKAEIISDPVPAGALQVLPSGQVVLLMADHQTVGGYPKIAVVTTADLPKAAQLNIGEKIQFQEVSLELAHQHLREQEAEIDHGVMVQTMT